MFSTSRSRLSSSCCCIKMQMHIQTQSVYMCTYTSTYNVHMCRYKAHLNTQTHWFLTSRSRLSSSRCCISASCSCSCTCCCCTCVVFASFQKISTHTATYTATHTEHNTNCNSHYFFSTSIPLFSTSRGFPEDTQTHKTITATLTATFTATLTATHAATQLISLNIQVSYFHV